MSTSRKNRRNKQRQRKIETLEKRELLSTVPWGGSIEVETHDEPITAVIASNPSDEVTVSLDDGGVLNVVGTHDDDRIRVRENRRGQVIVETDGDEIFRTQRGQEVRQLRIDGHDGDDRIRNNTSIPSYITGGDGRDRLTGGSGNDVLLGQKGRDHLKGRRGDDTLIGGKDWDNLNGGPGRDRIDGEGGNLIGHHRPAVIKPINVTPLPSIDRDPSNDLTPLPRPESPNEVVSGFNAKANASANFATSAATQSGSIVLRAGDGGRYEIRNVRSDIWVTHYLSDGKLDAKYGVQNSIYDPKGTTRINFSGADYVADALIQSDGKILILGTVNGATDIGLIRLLADGSFDKSFGSNGKVRTNISGTDTANDFLIQSDGKIVIAGETSGDFIIARYLKNGTLDKSFGYSKSQFYTEGTTRINFSGRDYALAIQQVGREFVVTGRGHNASRVDWVKLTPNGVPYDSSHNFDPGYPPYNGSDSDTENPDGQDPKDNDSNNDGNNEGDSEGNDSTEGNPNNGRPSEDTEDKSPTNGGNTGTPGGPANKGPGGKKAIPRPDWLTSLGKNHWQITGTNGNDNVVVRNVHSDGELPGDHSIEVKYNGATYNFGRHSNVKRIIFLGGEGDDVFRNFTNKPVTADGQGGDDIIRGGGGDDILRGGDGDDRLYGGNGDDRLNGGEGDDRLKGGKGNDSRRNGRDKGDKNDHSNNDGPSEDSSNPKTPSTNNPSPDKPSVALPNWLTRNGSNWSINGTNNADRVVVKNGTSPKDHKTVIIEYNGQSHTLGRQINVSHITFQGNNGHDFFQNFTNVPVTVDGGAGNDEIHGGGGSDLLRGGDGHDRLFGGAGSDTLRGGNGNDQLHGQRGNDLLKGGNGNDTLLGGKGNDRLNGDSGSDLLKGEAGDDHLIALDRAFDSLYGGAGNDSFNVGKGFRKQVIKGR